VACIALEEIEYKALGSLCNSGCASPEKGLCEWIRVDCLAIQVNMPFYRAKDMIYNVRFTSSLHYKALGGLHHKTHEQLSL
jgi:hypothetical protein